MAVKIEIGVELEKIIPGLNNLAKELQPYANSVMAEIAQHGAEIASQVEPQITRMGSPMPWASMWTFYQPIKGKDRENVYIIHNVYSDQKLVTFAETGTKPHLIRPKAAEYLMFVVQENGSEHFVKTKLVHHPGTKAYHMTDVVSDKLDPIIDKYIAKTVAQVDKFVMKNTKL